MSVQNLEPGVQDKFKRVILSNRETYREAELMYQTFYEEARAAYFRHVKRLIATNI